jgi:hypothetical protein
MTYHERAKKKAAELVKRAVQLRQNRLQAESDFQTALHTFDAELSRLLDRLERLASAGDADISDEPMKRSGTMRQLAESAEQEAAILECCDEALSSIQRRRQEVAQMLDDKRYRSK